MRFSATIFVFLSLLGGVLAEDRKPIDRFRVVRNGRYGYIDHTGKIVIPPQFLWSADFSDDGYAATMVCGRTQYLDESGHIGTVPEARGELAPDDAIFTEQVGNKYGFVDRARHTVIPPRYDNALPFQDGLAAVQVGTQWGFIDRQGNMVIEPKFAAAYYFYDGRANVKVDGQSALIDRGGRIVYRGEFFSLYREGMLAVTVDSKNGYIDSEGRTAIPAIFEDADWFSEGLAPVKQNGKWGYIDRSGNLVIRPQFDQANSFAEGRANVMLNDREGLIDHSGAFVLRPIYDHVYPMPFGLAVVYFHDDGQRDRFGYAKADGTFIWGPIDETPDHGPLTGWTEEDRRASYVPGFCDPRPQGRQ